MLVYYGVFWSIVVYFSVILCMLVYFGVFCVFCCIIVYLGVHRCIFAHRNMTPIHAPSAHNASGQLIVT